MNDLCEFGGCIDPAEWRVEATSRKRNNAGVTDVIVCCTKHADLLSAQHETGPRARITVTRTRIPSDPNPHLDAAL